MDKMSEVTAISVPAESDQPAQLLDVTPSTPLFGADPLDDSAQSAQVLDKAGIATVDMEDVVHFGHSISHQSGKNKASSGANVRRPHRRTGQNRHSPDYCMVSVGPSVCT
jgi:hypothetical protein